MKLLFTLFFAALASATATSIEAGETSSLKAGSDIGRNLMSKARALNDNNNNEWANMWVADYSLKFQGCHHVKQWNAEADEDQDVKLSTKRLVRFRLCPTDSCSETSASGCSSDYGDYIVDMDSYMQAYYQSKQEAAEQECGNYVENYCNCQDNGDDQYSEESCQYNCIVEAGMTQCYEYMENQMNAEVFDIEQYMECGQFEFQNQNQRRMEENQEVQYFVGPFCSSQGGAINMGMFTDDACTVPVEDDYYGAKFFEQMTGTELPYSQKSLVGSECLSCLQVDENENNNNNNNNGNQQVELTEVCQQAYQAAGKCEDHLPEGTTYYPNENACNYIAGIKTIREDGMVFFQPSHANAVSTAFIVIFAMAFMSMGFYVWYLRTRLAVKPNALL